MLKNDPDKNDEIVGYFVRRPSAPIRCENWEICQY